MIDKKGGKIPNSKAKSNVKNKVIWSVLFVFIAIATIWTVISSNKSFSGKDFISFIQNGNPVWLIMAILSSFGFIFFEGAALFAACRPFISKRKIGSCVAYSAADIYFSAITPSATGGQPACAYLMIQDGISGMAATAILLANLTMYTLSIIVIAVVVFLAFPSFFSSFDLLARLLIVIGFVMQFALMLFFIAVLTSKNILHNICSKIIKLLAKFRLIKNEAQKQEKLALKMDEYRISVEILRGKRKMLFKVFIFNLLQRLSYTLTSVFAFLATGGAFSNAGKMWALQSYSVIGSNSVPIPGAMGVSDYLMLNGFKLIMSADNAYNLELLSRSLSFYVCVIFCGVVALTKYLLQKRGKIK